MFPTSMERILATVPDDAVVLDIGAWGKPFTRANWVLDRNPYATRGLYGQDGEGPERFIAETWIVRDICDREPYPFADKSIDFVVCSHTLEDVRDPIFVCSEMNRIARAGYVETPSRLEEQSYGFQGPWVGWGHHHWMIEEEDGGLVFTFKHHVMHGRDSDHFPLEFHQALEPEEKVVRHWWDGELKATERIVDSAEALDPYLADFVTEQMRRHPGVAPATASRPSFTRRAARRLRQL
jgi:SAM-dependent methyltransferase